MTSRRLGLRLPPAWHAPLAAALVGGIASATCFGWAMVSPVSVEWLMRGDFALHFLGWHLYRHGPWAWPVGATPLLLWPIGSSVGLTDSIPVASILLKPFDAVLPSLFQFIGPWLVLSFALQGLFGVLLMRLATPQPFVQLLGASILMLSPPLMFRVGHAALTAHWLLLASLWLALRPDTSEPSRRTACWWSGLCAVTAATQPYLLLMVVVLMAAAHARQILCTPRRAATIALSGAMALAGAYVALWQSGSLMVPADQGLTVGGFGAWSTNLLSFVMPTQGPTLLFPGLFGEANFEQYEGYAYLGLGSLLLASVSLAGRGRHVLTREWWRGRVQHLPLVLGLTFLAVMALGPRVSAGTQTLLVYDATWWGPLRIFRTNGRMIWPVFYATTVAVLFAVTRLRERTAMALLAIAVSLQAADVQGLARRMADNGTFGFRDPLEHRFWRVVPPHYGQVLLVPSNVCAPSGGLDPTAFSLRAAVFGIGINAGQTARYDVRRAEEYCESLQQDIRDGRWSKDALYVLRADLLPSIKESAGDTLACTAIDGYGVCVAAETVPRWSGSLDIVRSRVPPLGELRAFYADLNRVYRDELGRAEDQVAGSLERRLDGLMWYLGYRIDGCDASEAEQRSLARVDGSAPAGLCSTPSIDQVLPPADQTYAFARKLALTLAAAPVAATYRTAIDAEGEAVWLQAYAQQRLLRLRETEARERVLAQIRGLARP